MTSMPSGAVPADAVELPAAEMPKAEQKRAPEQSAAEQPAAEQPVAVPMTWWPRRWPRFLTITPVPAPALVEHPGAWIRAILRHAWMPLTIASLLNALTYLAAGLISSVIGWVVDEGLRDGLSTHLLPGIAALVGLGLTAGVVGSFTEVFSMGAWATGWQPSARGAAHKLGRHPRAVTRAVASGDVVSTATSDADAVGALMYFLSTVVGSAIAMVVVGTIMLRMDVGLGLLVLLGLPVVLVLVGTLIKPLNRRMSAQREEQGRLTTVTTDVVAGLRVLRGIGGEDVYSARYAEQSGRVRDAGIRVASTQALLAAIRAGAPMVLTALVVGATATAALQGRLTVGEFVTFYGYTTFLIWPLGTFADLMQFMTRAWVGAKKAARLAAVEPLVSDAALDPAAVLDPAGDLVDLSSGVRLRGGAMTAVVCAAPGASAALAERLGRPDDAAPVTLGGTDLRHLPVAQVRRAVVVSGAHAEAFAGPLAAEVLGEEVPLTEDRPLEELMRTHSGTYRPDATRAAVALRPEQEEVAHRALEVAVAGDVVDSLGGLEGQLTEKARNLSGGQRQRLALARAVARRSPVLVLIEPTSALDSHTEDLVARRLRAEREGLTTVVVTASPLLLGRCDEVVLVEETDDEGVVREVVRGTHHELSSLPAYAAVVNRTPSPRSAEVGDEVGPKSTGEPISSPRSADLGMEERGGER